MKLIDNVDKKILAELELDPTIAFSALSKRCRISRERLSYRVKRLESAGIFEGVGAIIDREMLRYDDVYALISCPPEQYAIVEKELLVNPYTKWVTKTMGKYQYFVVFSCVRVSDVVVFVESLPQCSLECLPIRNFLLWKPLFANSSDILVKKQKKSVLALKEIDLELLELLATNARATIVELAGLLDVSTATVLQKIRAYKKSDLLKGYFCKINVNALGLLEYQLFLRVPSLSSISALLESVVGVVYADTLIGTWNVRVTVVVPNTQIFFSVLQEIVKSLMASSYEYIQTQSELKRTSFPTAIKKYLLAEVTKNGSMVCK